MARKTNSKEIILNAAEAVVAEMGAAHLSLDVVAHKAGVSKGGLLYNFPSKQALLKGMVERLIAKHFDDRAREEAKLPPGAGRSLKASVLAALSPNEQRQRIGRSILAALAHDKSLLEPLKEAYSQHSKELKSSGMSFERAAIVSLASDGLMFRETLGLSPFLAAERKRVVRELIAMVDEMEGGSS